MTRNNGNDHQSGIDSRYYLVAPSQDYVINAGQSQCSAGRRTTEHELRMILRITNPKTKLDDILQLCEAESEGVCVRVDFQPGPYQFLILGSISHYFLDQELKKVVPYAFSVDQTNAHEVVQGNGHGVVTDDALVQWAKDKRYEIYLRLPPFEERFAGLAYGAIEDAETHKALVGSMVSSFGINYEGMARLGLLHHPRSRWKELLAKRNLTFHG